MLSTFSQQTNHGYHLDTESLEVVEEFMIKLGITDYTVYERANAPRGTYTEVQCFTTNTETLFTL